MKLIKKHPAIYIACCYVGTVFGAALFALGVQIFYRSAQLVSGGVTGIAMIINLLLDLPVGIMIIAMNIPIFILAFRHFGFKYLLGSIIGTVTSSVFMDLLALTNFMLTDDPLLCALYGGVLTGLGTGIMYSLGTSTGGFDVIAKVIKEKYPYINFSSFLLYLNGVIILAYALIFNNYEKAMYTALALLASSKMMDVVLYGLSTSKLCFIISEHSDEIKDEIVKKLHRGVTLIRGKGAYSGHDKQVLLCVVKHQQIVEIRRLIWAIDRQAFVIVSDARDVFGRGFGNIANEK